MKDRDTIEMMRRCSEEIKMLRGQIDRLTPLANAYESVRTILALLPQANQGHGEDLAWRLDCEIAKLESVEPTESE